jgi:hypothetical protein
VAPASVAAATIVRTAATRWRILRFCHGSVSPYEQAEQPAVPGQRDRVHVDSSAGCEQRVRVGSGKDGRRVAVQ